MERGDLGQEAFLLPRANIDRGHLNAVGGYAEGRVLDSLEFINKGWGA